MKSVSFRCGVFGGFGGDRNLISCRKKAGESPGILAGLLPAPGFVSTCKSVLLLRRLMELDQNANRQCSSK